VTKADLDPEQQKMVATNLIMADRLNLNCLAEGVETLGEHAILAQLGCRYVQGFGIAKPMPFDQTLEWTQHYQTKQAPTEKNWAQNSLNVGLGVTERHTMGG
jgi:EAL domain-containing protein (putative c-di-GMP-specific phosphodiesterase class I)